MSGYTFWKWPIAQDEVFMENATCFATVNLKCLRPGHTMIITKDIKPRYRDLSDTEVRDMTDLATRTYKLLRDYYNLDRGCTMTIQDGEDAGQTVKHLHLHIVPNLPTKVPQFQRGAWEAALQVHSSAPDPEQGTVIPPRTRQEMKDEAEAYREFLRRSKVVKNSP